MQVLAAWGLVAGLALAAEESVSKSPAEKALRKAGKLFEEEHWAEARAAYDQARDLETDWRSPRVRLAVEGAVASSLKLKLWDDAISRAEEFIAKTKGSFAEAVGERFLAGLYMTIPHHGTKRGSTYLRGEHTQGVYVSSWRKDRREAIRHYERARELLIGLAENVSQADAPNAAKQRALTEAERIGVNFDLVTSLAQRDAHRYGRWGWCRWWWENAFEPEEDSEAVEEADYEEPRWWHHGEQEPPTGIPLGPDGKPRFVKTPRAYASGLGEGPKIRYLLDEVQRLDTSETKDDAARALLRWAMIARSLYGPETANQWSGRRVRYDRFGQALPSQPDRDRPKKKMWELEDDEAITIVGGRLRVITLPASESPVSLLRLLEKKYPKSAVRPEAHYARALYLQTRQRFPQALNEYAALIETHPKHKRAAHAKGQVDEIREPDVILGMSGVHLPGGKPKLSFTHRNTEKVELKAYSVDLVKYVQDRMEDESEQYWRYRNIRWDFFHNERWKSYKGKEVAGWTQTIERLDGHRTAEGSTRAPLPEPGAYLVEARPVGRPKDISRALVLVTDIAIVQKKAVGKGLIYVADARTGQPLADKAVRIYEHWTIWKDRKHTLHWTSSVETTNRDGVIEYTRKQTKRSPQVDAVVVGEGGRMAFSFFQSWAEHDPGYYWEEGPRYYVVTDRPVYRPGQTVRFRVWQRQLRQRAYQPPQAGQSIRIEVYDARNNEVKEFQVTTDEYGCASGEYALDDEPPLGVWHLRVNHYNPDARRHGGGLFRVEEYKKPEFEVTVKPAKSQARLGEKIKARIAARYYFGAPVARGKITYKVFREEYQHVYWGPGEYDWLYGKGYGRHYYAYPWLPWWGRWGCFICCKGWWPGYPWAWVNQRVWYFPWGYYGDTEGNWRGCEPLYAAFLKEISLLCSAERFGVTG